MQISRNNIMHNFVFTHTELHGTYNPQGLFYLACCDGITVK